MKYLGVRHKAYALKRFKCHQCLLKHDNYENYNSFSSIIDSIHSYFATLALQKEVQIGPSIVLKDV